VLENLGHAGLQGWGKFSKESGFCPLHFCSPNTAPNHKKELLFPVTGESHTYAAVWQGNGLDGNWKSWSHLIFYDAARLTFKDQIKTENSGFRRAVLITSFVQIWKWVLTRAIDFPPRFAFSDVHAYVCVCNFNLKDWKAPLPPLPDFCAPPFWSPEKGLH